MVLELEYVIWIEEGSSLDLYFLHCCSRLYHGLGSKVHDLL
jgi:hypothetical protein